MCQALREIFAEEFDAMVKEAVKEKTEVSLRESLKELDKERKKLDKSREELDKGREELDKDREELDVRRMELEKRGVNRMGKLVKFLLKKKQYDILEQISEDEDYREQMFMEYKIS